MVGNRFKRAVSDSFEITASTMDPDTSDTNIKGLEKTYC